MSRIVSTILLAGISLLGASAAQAGTHWSVGINLPVPALVVTTGGNYAAEPPPVYYVQPPEVRYLPAHVYEAPPADAAPQVVYLNQQPVYGGAFRGGAYRGWDNDARWVERARWEHERHEHEEQRWSHDEHRRDDDRAGWRRHD